MEVKITTPDTTADKVAAEAALRVASEFKVTSPAMAEIASDELAEIKARKAALEEKRKSIVKPLQEATKAVQALFKPATDALDEADRIYRDGLSEYAQGQFAAIVEQNKKLVAETEARRAELLAEGNDLEAEMLVAPVAEVPKLPGIQYRTKRKAAVVSEMALIKFVLENPAFSRVIKIDESAVAGLVAELEAANAPGLEFFDDVTIAVVSK